MGIGKRIKEAREAKGYKQKQLGDMIGVTSSAITNYENETSHPKGPILYALLNVLDCDANFLFQDEMRKLEYEYHATPWEMENHIKKYRSLDEYGKKNIDTLLENEYERCRIESDAQKETANEMDELTIDEMVAQIKQNRHFHVAASGTTPTMITLTPDEMKDAMEEFDKIMRNRKK